ncbi:MAG TPA: acetyl-CoA carboxylase biotin carboxyl carrier protein [Casimicrobiaceae bacterium]|nr:acetyl-CoA carboxylase biotin carboxyl carrier protein [Casimicrobiaceae bacterium]
MSDTKITRADVDAILKVLESAEHLRDFHLKYGDLEVRVSRDVIAQGGQGGAVAPESVAGKVAAPTIRGRAEAGVGQPPPARVTRDAAVPEGMVVVKAPMVGTFYRAPSPGAASFVEVGDKVQADTVVCIIEVMKLMNTIHAGAVGVVREVRVENSQPVEYGQVLIVIEPKQ